MKDERTGQFVVSSQAFNQSKSDGTVSGDLGQLLNDDGLDVLVLYPAVLRAVGAVALSVGSVRTVGCSVEHRPLDTDWYHGGIVGVGNSKPKKRDLKAASQEIVAIDQVEAQRHEDEKKAKAVRAQQIQNF